MNTDDDEQRVGCSGAHDHGASISLDKSAVSPIVTSDRYMCAPLKWIVKPTHWMSRR
jgi:hypothetical protein